MKKRSKRLKRRNKTEGYGEGRQGTCLDFARQLQYGILKSKQIVDTTKPSARMGRKATGSLEDSRVAEISTDIRSRLSSFETKSQSNANCVGFVVRLLSVLKRTPSLPPPCRLVIILIAPPYDTLNTEKIKNRRWNYEYI